VPAKDWNHRFCAESLPEAALAVDGDTKIDLTLKPDELGSISDKVDQTLTQTFTRTEKAEILRQLGWQLCQAWAQNVLSNDEYNVELKALVAEGSKILASPTSSSPAQQPAAASTAPPIPPAPKTP
jgi:membrane-bound lytic murein transglycosylase B